VGEGETVGTLSILDGQPRAATGIAEDEVVGLKIGAEDFYELLSDNVEIVQGIFSRLTQEIRSYRYRQSSL
jgi:CRP-like cAMP-binding protein